MRIVFMGSPTYAVPSLEQLLASDYEIAAVYTQPDRPAGRGRGLAASAVKDAALKRGLTIVQPENFKSEASLAELAAFKPDVIVVCAYGQILPQALLDIPPRQCVNVHFSLLPRHRGASPAAAAILAGDAFGGVSIQLVRKKLDTGPLLVSGAIPITPADTAGSQAEKLSIIGAHLLQEALSGWLRGELEPRQQDEALSSYFGQVTKEEGEIDWTRPAPELWRRVRAYQPWPGCFTYWRGKQLKISEAAPAPVGAGLPLGLVIAMPDRAGALGVVTGKGVLKVMRLQYEGKKDMTVAEFLRGQREILGAVLPS